MNEILTSLRGALATIALCVVAYVTVVIAAAMLFAPQARLGALVERDGVAVGSRQIAQSFTRPEYVWPRPSAVAYAADAAGGSNLSPAGPEIRERSVEILARYGASTAAPLPAELVLASGSGLDPHVTEHGALYQAARVAAARGAAEDRVRAVITELATEQPFGGGLRLVNVLLLNLELDARFPLPQSTGQASGAADGD